MIDPSGLLASQFSAVGQLQALRNPVSKTKVKSQSLTFVYNTQEWTLRTDGITWLVVSLPSVHSPWFSPALYNQ